MKLTNIAEIAVLSLLFRSMEASLPFPLFVDLQAVRLVKDIDFEFAPISLSVGYGAQLATACVTVLFDRELQGFKGHVINLGCGFDTRSIRHDKETWTDIDSSEIMNIRADMLNGHVKTHATTGDITDERFIKSLATNMPTMILLEGVLAYYEEDVVNGILSSLRHISKDLKVVLTAAGSLYKGVIPLILATIGNTTKVRWGLDDPTTLERLGYKVQKVTPIYEVEPHRWKPLGVAFEEEPLYKEHATKVIVLERI